LLAEIDNLTAQLQAVLGGGIGAAAGLQYIQNTVISPTMVTNIEITTEEIDVEGEAANRAGVIEYALALESLKVFKEVRIASIDDRTSGTSVQFVITLTR
jgi:hypothetical protein